MKEKIICLVSAEGRSYYRAVPLAKEFLDKDHNLINTAGTLPEGEVEEFDVNTKTVKHYKGGKLDGDLQIIDLASGEITFSEKYKDGILLDVADHTLHGTPIVTSAPKPQPTYNGTVIKVNKATQSFYIDGKEVAEQTVAANGAILELLGEIPDGPAKEFDDNGLLRADAQYKNNKLEGKLIRYDEKAALFPANNTPKASCRVSANTTAIQNKESSKQSHNTKIPSWKATGCAAFRMGHRA